MNVLKTERGICHNRCTSDPTRARGCDSPYILKFPSENKTTFKSFLAVYKRLNLVSGFDSERFLFFTAGHWTLQHALDTENRYLPERLSAIAEPNKW